MKNVNLTQISKANFGMVFVTAIALGCSIYFYREYELVKGIFSEESFKVQAEINEKHRMLLVEAEKQSIASLELLATDPNLSESDRKRLTEQATRLKNMHNDSTAKP